MFVARTHPDAAAAWERRRSERFRSSFAPPPRLEIDEWADRYRKLSAINSALPGDWHTDYVPFIRGILRSITDPEINMVVFRKPAQVSYTEGVIGNTLGYYMHQQPRSMLVVQPSKEDAEDWSKDKLQNLLDATPVLEPLVTDASVKGGGSTLLMKRYPGGILKIVGGTSPKGLARTSAPLVIIDEVDRLPRSAGKEGRPVDIVLKRLTSFWNGKAIVGSTPTNEGESEIDDLYGTSDQREFRVPCPHCGHRQTLRWGDRDSSSGLKWEVREVGRRRLVIPESVFYLCEHCACAIEEREKHGMVATAAALPDFGWVKTNADAASPGVAGFSISALVSPFNKVRWPALVQEFLDALGDEDKLKVFVNTRLGEVFRTPGERVDGSTLEQRAERWLAPDGARIEVPAGVGLLTAAVDVQGDRLEVLVVGWGEGEEAWQVAHHRLYGDPEQAAVWQQLEAVWTRSYRHELGAGVRIRAMAIDSGYAKNEVYAFVAPRQLSGVYAVKGAKPEQTDPVRRSKSRNAAGVKLVTVGTVPMKDTLFSRLKKSVAEQNGDAPPGYIHLRAADPEWHNGSDPEFFAQFTREKRVYKNRVRCYVPTGANEAIDLFVYNFAALHILGPVVRHGLARLRDQLHEAGKALARPAAAKPTKPPLPPQKRKSWINRY